MRKGTFKAKLWNFSQCFLSGHFRVMRQVDGHGQMDSHDDRKSTDSSEPGKRISTLKRRRSQRDAIIRVSLVSNS